jgi:hypothetical protein
VRIMKVKKRFLYIFSVLVPLAVILAYLIYISSYVQPKIDFQAQITKISSGDYQTILANLHEGILAKKPVISQDQDIGMDKFRNVSVKIKVTTPIGLIKSVKIERDPLHKYLENDDRIQILSGGGFEDGNGREYTDYIDIYLKKEISEDQLRMLLKDCKIKVTWQNVWHSLDDKIFHLQDYLK